MRALIVIIEGQPTKAEDTGKEGGGIFSKPASRAYSDGWEQVFGKKEAELSPETKKSLN
jgi:hypothetical protein